MTQSTTRPTTSAGTAGADAPVGADRPDRPGQPVDRRAVRGRDPRGRGPDRRRGAARRPHRQAHRPLAPGQVHRQGAVGSAGKIWWGEVNRPIALEHYDRLRARLMDYLATATGLRPGLLHRRRIRPIAGASASTPRRPGRASSPGTSSAGRRPPTSPRSPRTSRSSTCPSFQADPATEGTRTGTAILRQPRAGWRSSSSAPSTPARSRSRPSRS